MAQILNINQADQIKDQKEKQKCLQKCFAQRAEMFHRLGIPLIIVFEGMDAAGKSGCIKRIIKFLDKKRVKTISISAPTVEEKKYNYLHRFWICIPKRGDIAIFDRSWYGRVLVERVEEFCSESEWRRAYSEINSFEKLLSDDGTLIIKFWLDISEDEQLARFKARATDPEKVYKITDEDWRNRMRRPEYDAALTDLMEKTDTEYASWHIIPANDKRSARISVLSKIVSSMDEVLLKML